MVATRQGRLLRSVEAKLRRQGALLQKLVVVVEGEQDARAEQHASELLHSFVELQQGALRQLFRRADL